MSILQSVVNTNISSVTDPNGARGNPSQGVMAFECGTAGGTGTAVATVADTVLIAGAETVGAYQGILPVGAGAAAGVEQTVTLTFATAHGWTAATHDIEVQLVGAAADAAAIDTGHCSGGSFGTTLTLEFQRSAGNRPSPALSSRSAPSSSRFANAVSLRYKSANFHLQFK